MQPNKRQRPSLDRPDDDLPLPESPINKPMKRQRPSVDRPDDERLLPELSIIKVVQIKEDVTSEDEAFHLPPRSPKDSPLLRSRVETVVRTLSGSMPLRNRIFANRFLQDENRIPLSNPQPFSVSIPSDSPNGAEANANKNTIPVFLWHNVPRRPQFESTSENKDLFRRVKFMLWARIFTGEASRQVRSVLWPDIYNEMALSKLIGEIWREQRALIVQDETNQEYRPSEQPAPQEARKVRLTL